MAFCSNCGKEINANAAVCLNCGAAVNNQNSQGIKDTGSFGWGVLGFMIPVAGLLLWLLWSDLSPNNARSAGIGALVSTILSVVFVILWFVLFFGLAFSSFMYY